MTESCQACRFYRETPDGPHMKPYGTCRIRAPGVASYAPRAGGDGYVIVQQSWPAVKHDDWCGEYEPPRYRVEAMWPGPALP